MAYPLLQSEQHSGPGVLLLSLVWGLAALMRPDGLLFAFAGAAGWVLALNFTKPALIGACKLVALPIVFAVLQACFRQVYYDDWVPNTYYAKVAYTFDRLVLGASYVASNWRALAVFTLSLPIAFYAAVVDRGRRRRIIFVTVPLLAYGAFVVAIGGDTMPQGRHLVVVLFLMALTAAEGLQWLVSRGGVGGRTAGAVAAMIVAAAVLAEVQNPGRSRLSGQSWVWRGRPLGLFLAKAFADRDPLLAVDAAGSTPYYAEIDSLDMLGLNDKYLARHRPADFGRGPFGHELGDGAYILRRKPDLVMFHVPPGRLRPVWRGGIEMINTPDFVRYYQLVRFDTGDPTGKRAMLWVRREDSRVGITRTADQITVPGFLLAGGPVAGFDDTGRLVTFMPPLTTARVESFLIGSGTWRINVNSTSQVTLTLKPPGLAEIRGSSSLTFEIPAPFRELSTYIDVEIRTGRTAANIHAVQFERLR